MRLHGGPSRASWDGRTSTCVRKNADRARRDRVEGFAGRLQDLQARKARAGDWEDSAAVGEGINIKA